MITKKNGLVLMATTKKKPQTKKVIKPSTRGKATKPRVAGPAKPMELDEIANLEEPLYEVLPKADRPKSGRPKSTNYIPYKEAREFMIGEMIPSRNKFLEWWDRNKPKAIPRFPYRVYGDEWIGWNDFLGNDNEFGLRVGKSWRPLEEAVVWVHKLKIESYTKWMEYAKTGALPDDIPARPDLIYSTWKTWMHWLGNRPMEALAVAKEAQKLQIYYIIHEQGVPENVFTFGVETMGQTALKERWEREKFDIVRLFWHEADKTDKIKKLVEGMSSTYLGLDKQRICPNVWEINYYLELTLQRIYKF
jgi:hypothetical protein